MPVFAQTGGDAQPAPKKQPAAVPAQNPSGLVEAPGFGSMPWQGTPAPQPSPQVNTQTPSTVAPRTLQAARGVIGTIRHQAQLQGVPVAVALAVAKEESGFSQEAVSPAGAIGIMQLEPATARGLGVDPNNWQQNIQGGIHYLADQLKRYNGDVNQALQAYNGGPGNVGSNETQHYATNVLAIANQISGGKYKPAGGSTGVYQVSSPLPGNPVVTSSFGARDAGGNGDFHGGVDLAAPLGTEVHAMIGGRVLSTQWTEGGGNIVEIEDRTGRIWSYAHLAQQSPVKEGDKIQAGATIGQVGATGQATGPHLHIGVTSVGISERAPAGRAAFEFAQRQIGQPYVWGGSTPKTGFDCSGLVQWAYKQIGIDLPRTSEEMIKVGTPVSQKALKPGDLVFLEPGSNGPGHVVMYAGRGIVVAAPHTGTDVQAESLASVISADGWVGARRIVQNPKRLNFVNPMATIRKSFGVGWGKTGKISLTATDFLPPSAGGVNGSGQGAADPTAIPGVTPGLNMLPQGVDAAVVPGGQAAMPSNAAAWQQVLASGAASPQTQQLAKQAGAMVQETAPLAAVYNNPGLGG